MVSQDKSVKVHPLSENISATHHYLLTEYGPLLTLKHLSEVLHNTPNGLRMVIVRQKHPFSEALADAQRRVGRRVYFEASRIADIIDQDRSTDDILGLRGDVQHD